MLCAFFGVQDADGKLMKASYSVFSVRPRSGVCSKDNEVCYLSCGTGVSLRVSLLLEC